MQKNSLVDIPRNMILDSFGHLILEILIVQAFLSVTVFTTMYPEEQQTIDNLIVKEYCFIIERFDKFSFSGILRGCLRHFN